MELNRGAALILTILLFAPLQLGCGTYGRTYGSTGGPIAAAPNISELAPNSATAGDAGFVLTVNGSNLGNDTVVYWNSSVRATTYVTGSQVTANISSSDVAMASNAVVYVHTAGQNSNMMNFTIN